MKSIYHYSKAIHLSKICLDRFIKPATEFVQYKKPVVWCSTREDFEPTAASASEVDGVYQPMSCEEMAEVEELNPVRIEVHPSAFPHNWGAFRQFAGITTSLAFSLAQEGIKQGSKPIDWRVSFDPIPASEWLAVEYYYNHKWWTFKATEELLSRFATMDPTALRAAVVSMSNNEKHSGSDSDS
jgi:hypothetical protein